MKSEPDELSIMGLRKLETARWDGVRNYQARNFLRAMKEGDLFFFYHSSCARPGIAGIGRICREAYPDPTALDPDSPYYESKTQTGENPWSAVDVAFVEAFDHVLELPFLKSRPELAELPLVKRGSRLSVMPVTNEQWQDILQLRGRSEV